MSGGSHIVAVGPESPQAEAQGAAETDSDVWELQAEAEEYAEQSLPSGWLLPSLAGAVVASWTGFFLWAQRTSFAGGITPRQGTELTGAWAIPVLLVCVIWLIAMRTSRRETRRFGEAARLLSAEAAHLEHRLTVVNRELSLAREFIAAQSRDLEALGRVSAERISEHADRLQGLIRENGAQVDAISSVSTTALDNMERLRGQLPVIASSAKDVANTIGHAGRTAQDALSDLIEGFNRLAAAGVEGESKVGGVRIEIDRTLGQFDERLNHIQATVSGRIEELEHRGAELRQRLSTDEAAALDGLRARSAALTNEAAETRQHLDSIESEALTSLRARLNALRDEGAAVARALRDGEAGAMNALNAAKDRLEEEVRGVLQRLDQLDRDALEAARNRIATLSQEAGEFDDRLAERNAQFLTETEQRLTQAAERHDQETARLAGLFEQLDSGLAERMAVRDAQQAAFASACDGVAARLEGLSDRIAAIAAFGNQAEHSLVSTLSVLGDRFAATREALGGTDKAVADLTDGAVRLLELLQASTEQSRDHLPNALATGITGLEAWEQRTGAIRQTIEESAERGKELSGAVAQARTDMARSLAELDEMQKRLGAGSEAYGATLATLRSDLHQLGGESEALARTAQDQLTMAIEQLQSATRAVVETLGKDSEGAITGMAERLGSQCAAAIDSALRMRTAEAVGQLEQAAGHAAGVSREAAIQLRDQLAKVDELAGNLERRVTQARARAEEQVDNDFARRVALITEALNSYAIDIAKALSTEVTDTAWSAYLKGDRGVFTRRAVRLMEPAEARDIVRIYEEDGEFREHVSRYIHDFEAMLRQLLSTRDGHALGVTLLSSDMGKLYVALAQAIERLRT